MWPGADYALTNGALSIDDRVEVTFSAQLGPAQARRNAFLAPLGDRCRIGLLVGVSLGKSDTLLLTVSGDMTRR